MGLDTRAANSVPVRICDERTLDRWDPDEGTHDEGSGTQGPLGLLECPAHPMSWWHWLVLGLVLVLLEMAAAGGFYVIFFGIAAIAISALHLFDLAGPAWFQFLLFSLISVGALLVFRGPLLRMMQPDSPADRDSPVGEIAIPLEDIPPGGVGRAELRGTAWSARNSSPIGIARGERCRVVKVERLMIFLEGEGART